MPINLTDFIDRNGMTLEFYLNEHNRPVFRVSSMTTGNTIGLLPVDSDLQMLHEAIGAYLAESSSRQEKLRNAVVEAAKDLDANMQGEWRYPARDRLQAALASTKEA